MADELITNALGGIVMFSIIQGYLIYLRVKMIRGHELTKWDRGVFLAMVLVALIAVIVYYVRAQVL